MKSFSGCWTCRLRRKKCDEKHPICDGCSALNITCYFESEKPWWMDGGEKQRKMAEQVKRQVKEKAQYRREERAVGSSSSLASETASTASLPSLVLSQGSPSQITPVSSTVPTPRTSTRHHHPRNSIAESPADRSFPILPSGDADAARSGPCTGGQGAKWPDAWLFTFYMDNLLPFLFPFYRPSVLEGGRSWVLDMMMTSVVVRQTALCHSSYFFSLALQTTRCSAAWERVFTQTKAAFTMLRESMAQLNERGISDNLHHAVRVLASILQVQRFDMAVANGQNCQAHLNAALALWKQIFTHPAVYGSACPGFSFDAIMDNLGPAEAFLPSRCIQVPSSEQAAFRFSSGLLMLDDIVASTALQEEPQLYKYHYYLLNAATGIRPSVNLEAIVGCQNWVLIQIGEIASLDAWKQKCKTAGNLDVMQLVDRAATIKEALKTQLAQVEADPTPTFIEPTSVLDASYSDYGRSSRAHSIMKPHIGRCSLITQVWAHAALIYLFVVVSGWQPANSDVRHHVGEIVTLLTQEMSLPGLLRTMVWPYCVAGCLAEPPLHETLRQMTKVLEPPEIFGSVHQALGIMEKTWRDTGGMVTNAERDLASCLRSQGEMVLLV